jgi:hypothetical protein
MLLALLLSLSPAHAGDVLVPSFTPATMSDFGPAGDLTEAVLQSLMKEDLVFVAPGEIQKRAGEVSEGCADSPECTQLLWARFPTARVAIIGTATWEEGQISARVRFHGPDEASPIEVMSARFPESDIPVFAEQVAFFTRDVLGLVPARAKPASGASSRKPVEEPTRKPPEDLDDPAPARPASRTPDPRADELERRKRGMPVWAWERYRSSGLQWDDWEKRALVRKDSVIVEAWGGAIWGDVDRQYDVRVAVDQRGDTLETIGTFQRETYATSSSFTTGASVGYAPLWWLEAGLVAGVHGGRKSLTTGWEQYLDGALVDAETDDLGAVPAWTGIAEPRLRFHLVPIGPVKPFLLAATPIRFTDGFPVTDLATLEYPDRPGAVGMGLSAGGGLAFDAPGRVCGFVEVPWTYWLTPAPYQQDTPAINDVPTGAVFSSQSLIVRAGLGVRL